MTTLPHIIFFKRSSQKNIIEKDIERWVQVYDPQRANNPAVKNLDWLIREYKEFRNVFYYRIGGCTTFLGKLLFRLSKVLYKPMDTLFIRTPSIGPGLFIQHGFATTIGAHKIGENCWINQQVTIGYKGKDNRPTIGNNVRISCGAKVLGRLTIGDNAVVGANAVVVKNVPPDCTVAGVPAHVIKRNGQRVNEPLV